MKSPVIKSPTSGSKGNGAFGEYYVLDQRKRIGLKVLHRRFDANRVVNEANNFLDGLSKGHSLSYMSDDYVVFAEIISELIALQMLKSTGQVPKTYGLCWVDSGWETECQIGLLMEHINGKTIEQYCSKEICREYHHFKSEFTALANTRGVQVRDWHTENVMWSHGRCIRIDLGIVDFYGDACQEATARATDNLLSLIQSFPKKEYLDNDID